MFPYHKIPTVYKRDPDNNYRTLLDHVYATPELEYLQNNTWVFTEKIDGTNIRIIYENETLRFGGKTEKAQIPTFLFEKLEEKFLPQLDAFKEEFGDKTVCFYGEGYGSRIQAVGKLYNKNPDFILFDVNINHWWFTRESIEEMGKQFNCDVVPVIGEGTLDDMVEKTKAGFNSQWGGFLSEGIIGRPKVELQARSGQRVITKIKHKDFNLN